MTTVTTAGVVTNLVSRYWKVLLLMIVAAAMVPVMFIMFLITSIGNETMVDIAKNPVKYVFTNGSFMLASDLPQTGGGGGSVVVGTCAPKCEGVDGNQAGFSVKRALELAVSEVGTTRATGYNQPGECMVSVRRWIHAGGGSFVGMGDVVNNYLASGAVRVTDGSLRPGDVVQYENLGVPSAFLPGVHTYMVLAVHENGTHDIIESNVPFGSGLVGVRNNQRLTPPPGFQAVVWRFAAQPDV